MRKAHFLTSLLKGLFLTLAVAVATAVTTVSAEAPQMGLGVYVVVEELAEAKDFYQRLLGKEPVVENTDFVCYSLTGGLLGIYRVEAFTHELQRGNSTVVYIQVDDIEKEFARVSEMGVKLVHEEIVREPYISLFMFQDPDGNAIEFYALD